MFKSLYHVIITNLTVRITWELPLFYEHGFHETSVNLTGDLLRLIQNKKGNKIDVIQDSIITLNKHYCMFFLCIVRSGGGQCTAVLRMLTRDGCVINVKTNADLIHQDDVDPYSPVIHFSNRVLR